jgi:hypothetical protein
MWNTAMRSWDPTVVRWRAIRSLARVMAVEKPMQYSVPWTSLSIVLGMAMRGTPASWSAWEKLSVSSPPIIRWRCPVLQVMEHDRVRSQVVHRSRLAQVGGGKARRLTLMRCGCARGVQDAALRSMCACSPA